MAPAEGTPNVVRGASWGFSILLIGELVVLQLLGLANGLALYVVAAAAYAFAGNRAVRPPVVSVATAARDGALAAAGAYGLTIPLRLIVAASSFSLLSAVVAVVVALAVGGAAGAIVGKARMDEAAEADG